VDLFHGTDKRAVPGIKREGLHPAEGLPEVLTVAHDPDTAEEYAHDAADYRNGKPAVLHFKVPADEWEGKYRGDHEDYGNSHAAGLRDTLPAKYIHAVTYPEPQKGGYYKARGS
jgi:hypothetical protein